MKKALLLLAICLMVVPAVGQDIMLDHGQFRSATAATNDDAYLPDGTLMVRRLPDSVWISADLSDAAGPLAKYGLPYAIDELYEETPGVDDEADLSATLYAVNSYDLATLYFMVEVTDEVISTAAGNGWQDDAIELFLDMDNSKIDGVEDGWPADDFDTNDGQFRLNPNIVDDAVVALTSSQNWDDAGGPFTGALTKRCEPMTGGWRGIFAVALEDWDVYPMPNGVFGVNIQIADNDGASPVAREAVLGLAPGDANTWQDPIDWLDAFTYCYTDISYGTATIDGDISEWDGITTHGLWFQNPGTGPLDDADDLAIYWSAMWDLDSLYVLTNVTADDALSNNQSADWQRDNVEVFFDFDHSQVENSLPADGNSNQMRECWTDGQSGGGTRTTTQVDTAGGWLVEWQIDFVDWGYITPPSGLIGFEVHGADNDGPLAPDPEEARAGVIMWYESHSDRAYTDESVFGAARLVLGETGVDEWSVLDR
jgi:hypothetical protein